MLPSGQTNRAFNCKCDCGKIKKVRLSHLVRGKIKSCGCLFKTMSGKSSSDLGVVYRSMKTRCKSDYFESHLYYDKGIIICDEWLNDFELFESWSINNGYKKGLQLDRKNNSKGYSPKNCRYVTPKVNVNNRDNTLYVNYKNKKWSLQLLLVYLKNPNKYNTVRSRILRGWDIEKALFKKPLSNYSSRK